MTFKQWLALTWIVVLITVIIIGGLTLLIVGMTENEDFRYFVCTIVGLFSVITMSAWAYSTLVEETTTRP